MAKKKSASKKGSKPAQGKANDGPQRLQRVLAHAGFGSRRQCEELILEGRVVVDGTTVTELGTRVDPKTAKISVDGTAVRPPQLVYFALNKPVGIVTTNRDPQGRPRVVDLINEPQRVFPVGRLDRNSEGLIILTNDGELSEQLAHPRYGVKKTYQVTVAGSIERETISQMRAGVHFAEGKFHVEGVRLKKQRAKSSELEIELREGKNREIRRILARLGHKVLQLRRTAIASVKLGSLPTGAYRKLTSTELKKLREEIQIAHRAASTDSRSKRKPRATKASTGGTKKTVASKRSKPRVGQGEIVISDGSDRVGTVIGAPESSKRSSSSRKKRSTERTASGKRKLPRKKHRKRES